MIITIIAIPLLHIFMQQQHISACFTLPSTTSFFLFFILGYFLKDFFIKMPEFIHGYKAAILSLILIIFQFIFAYYFYNKIFPTVSIIDYALFFIMGLSGIFCVFCICNISKKQNKIINYISANTLTILCVHIPISGLILGGLKNLFGLNTSAVPLVIALCITFVSMSCSLVAARFFHKYIPVIIGEKKKSSSYPSGNSAV